MYHNASFGCYIVTNKLLFLVKTSCGQPAVITL